ncbi:MAG: hypothetical protein Kow0032_07790 [Methyloligellaceae bacterium]
MRFVCAPADHSVLSGKVRDVGVVLYSQPQKTGQGAAGGAVFDQIRRRKLTPAPKAWDLLSIALSVVAADGRVERRTSVDGWTRKIELVIAVNDPKFWSGQKDLVESALRFLTTDIWEIEFIEGGMLPAPPREPSALSQECVALLSGGLDSLVGGLDLAAAAAKPYLVSQVSSGDKKNQAFFAMKIGGKDAHLPLNHNAQCPGPNERSQRSRSVVFFAYGVLAATALAIYQAGGAVRLYASENGLIAINPPLTPARLGALSTRTMHPVYLATLQSLLDNAGLRVTIENPYRFKTKGEMLAGCADQDFLRKYAHTATSCGRFRRFKFTHCGRCLPCLIRRAAFHAWGQKDRTKYVYGNLGKNDDDHAGYDDVRSAAMAVAAAKSEGLDSVIGASLSSPLVENLNDYRDVVQRGLDELAAFLTSQGVK